MGAHDACVGGDGKWRLESRRYQGPSLSRTFGRLDQLNNDHDEIHCMEMNQEVTLSHLAFKIYI